MKTSRKFFKTTFTVEVLSETTPVNGLSLAEIAFEIDEGDCSGAVTEVEVVELSPKQAAKALINQGSDSEFFQLSEDGEDLS